MTLQTCLSAKQRCSRLAVNLCGFVFEFSWSQDIKETGLLPLWIRKLLEFYVYYIVISAFPVLICNSTTLLVTCNMLTWTIKGSWAAMNTHKEQWSLVIFMCTYPWKTLFFLRHLYRECLSKPQDSILKQFGFFYFFFLRENDITYQINSSKISFLKLWKIVLWFVSLIL